MLNWLSQRKAEDVVGHDIVNARSLIPVLRLKLDKGGAPAARVYGEGIVEVAELLAHCRGLSGMNALAGQGLSVEQLDATYRDLVASAERCRSYLDSDNPVARAAADRLAMACLVFSHLYRLRFHARQAPEERRVEADALADTYANLTRVLAELGTGPGADDPRA
jgi:hypothetical protein